MDAIAELRTALEIARHGLVVSNNCHATDRPDLPRKLGETEWVIDNGKEIAAVDSALALLPAIEARLAGWRPIETAPKDGSEIDLWVSVGVRIANCRWARPSHANWGDRYGADDRLPGGWMTRLGTALDRRHGAPTHWMPLPTPPKQEG